MPKFTSKTAKEFGKKSNRKGVPNKSTTEIREKFEQLVTSNLETFQKDLEELKPEQRVKYIIEIAKFVLPTLKATEISTAGEFNPIQIVLGKKKSDQ